MCDRFTESEPEPLNVNEARRTFTAGWGTRDVLDVTMVAPELVAEVSADVARDTAGRWRHPVRYVRPRPDLNPTDAPRWDTGDAPSAA